MNKEYLRWLEKAVDDNDIIAELSSIQNDEAKITDAFYRDLEFGTGGLRGVIGAGTNRMNIYTVAKASQGLANYVLNHFEEGKRSIAVSYDSRIKSELFAQVASGVFAANGIAVHIFTELMPTPCLSFATRVLECSAGIMITASHNPSKYNGYKVYGDDGCQITTEAADEILAKIQKVDIFEDVKKIDFEAGVKQNLIQYISNDVYTAFIECVKNETLLSKTETINKDVAIVYSPLNGAGLKPVLRALNESGFTNITVVKEQEKPDGNFTTCPYPNPEIRETLSLGLQYAKKYNADLMLATDPDCDRVGIAVKNKDGEHELLSGNEVGMLLLDYICSQRIKNGTMPKNPVMIKTIVTIDMAKRIADKYSVQTIDVLTGFKFIGEQIGLLEKQNRLNDYIFGFEESYGYLSGTYVRDKDAVNGAFLICEMFAYYKTQNISLLDKLQGLYSEFGYCLNTLHSYEFEGASGFEKMQNIMTTFKEYKGDFSDKKIEQQLDYNLGIDGLPKSNVLKYLLSGNCSIVVRPSGTEPKLKIYISISAKTKESATEIEQNIVQELEKILGD